MRKKHKVDTPTLEEGLVSAGVTKNKWKKLPLVSLFQNKDNINSMDSRIARRLAASLDQEKGFGVVTNLVVMASKSKPDSYMVLGGNHRLEVLQALETPPEKVMCCVVPWMGKKKRMLLAQALNRIHGSDPREESQKLINELVSGLGSEVVDEILGHQGMVQQIISQNDHVSISASDDLNEEQEETDARPETDVRRMDSPKIDHIYRADCTTLKWPKNYFDAIVTDPPYKIGVFEKKWDKRDDVVAFTKDWLLAHLESLKPGGLVCCFINANQQDLVARAFRELKMTIRDPLYWIRYISKIPGKRLNHEGTVYTTTKISVEPIVIAQKPPKGTYKANFEKYGVGGFFFEDAVLPYVSKEDRNKAIKLGSNILALAKAGKLGGRGHRALQGNTKGWIRLEGRRPSNVIVLPEDDFLMPLQFQPFFVLPTIRNRSKESEGHETQKRTELLQWILRLVTPRGGIALDPFVGSGTTVEAALLEGRHAIGVEKSVKIVKKARARIKRVLKCLPVEQT